MEEVRVDKEKKGREREESGEGKGKERKGRTMNGVLRHSNINKLGRK